MDIEEICKKIVEDEDFLSSEDCKEELKFKLLDYYFDEKYLSVRRLISNLSVAYSEYYSGEKGHSKEHIVKVINDLDEAAFMADVFLGPGNKKEIQKFYRKASFSKSLDRALGVYFK